MIAAAHRFPYRFFPRHQYVQQNAYFAHPENVLLAMVTDERAEVRRTGIERVIAARALSADQVKVRVVKVPALNFNAQDYPEMINWEREIVIPPPVLSTYTTEELQSLLQVDDNPPVLDVPAFPCHTQAGCGAAREDGD